MANPLCPNCKQPAKGGTHRGALAVLNGEATPHDLGAALGCPMPMTQEARRARRRAKKRRQRRQKAMAGIPARGITVSGTGKPNASSKAK